MTALTCAHRSAVRGSLLVHSPLAGAQTQAQMSSTAGAAPPTIMLGLDLSGSWQQGSLPSGGGGGSRTPLRLPALVSTTKGAHRRSGMARLSISEPSLLTTNENILFEGFSSSRRFSMLQKRLPPPPLSKSSVILSCKTCHPSKSIRLHDHEQNQTCHRPSFIHFTKAIQPTAKPRPGRRHSHNPALSSETGQGDLRPPTMRSQNPPHQGEPLSIIGKPCLLSCSERPPQVTATGPPRAQLHVFLPTEAEGEEADRESVDEGFMDELDGKITSLKIQQGAPKTVSL